jgi:hypothetical protein
MVEKGCSRKAVFEAFVNRTELSMLIKGMPFIKAKKLGGIQKLLPVLTTALKLWDTCLKESRKAFASLGMNSLVGVLASRGFRRNSTAPNLLSLFWLRTSP